MMNPGKHLGKAAGPGGYGRRLIFPLILCGALCAPPILRAQYSPRVDVWFEHGNEFDRGEPGRVMYSGDAGSYLALLQVDTDGRMTVLSPRHPNDRSRFGVQSAGVPFQADPAEGVGYVFAIASATPFDFRNYRGSGNSWRMGTLGERANVDPFELVDRFARASIGSRGSYSIAYAPYAIGRGGERGQPYHGAVRFDDGYGYGGYGGYYGGNGYDYFGGYRDPWIGSPYRRGYTDFRYSSRFGYGANNRFSRDPRTRALRHCPDGTLAPYTTPCRAFSRPRWGQPHTRSNSSRPQTRGHGGRGQGGPVIHEPVIHQPVIRQPRIHQPVIHQPVIHQPRIHQPVVRRPPAGWSHSHHASSRPTPGRHRGH